MRRIRGLSWVVALAIATLAGALCGRAAAQEPPATAPGEKAEALPGGTAGRVQQPCAENSAPEPAPKRSRQAGDVQKVFVIKNVRVRPLAEVLAVFPATITFSSYERSSALGVSAPPAVMAAIEETIKRLDVPTLGFRNIELTAEILEASPRPQRRRAFPPSSRPSSRSSNGRSASPGIAWPTRSSHGRARRKGSPRRARAGTSSWASGGSSTAST